MKTNVIFCGESSQVMRQEIPDDSIDLTVTSPPYDNLRNYNGFEFDFESIVAQLWRVTKPGGVVVWVVGDATINGSETGTSFRQALGFMDLGFRLHDTMIYDKTFSIVYNPHDKRYKNRFEYMFVFCKDSPNTFNGITDVFSKNTEGRKAITNRRPNGSMRQEKNINIKKLQVRGNIWAIDSGYMRTTKDREAFSHPAIFPEALARDHIISWSNPGDVVLDPFVGSGTTPKMAKETGRQYIGIDISQEYCNLAERRIAGAKIPLPGLL